MPLMIFLIFFLSSLALIFSNDQACKPFSLLSNLLLSLSIEFLIIFLFLEFPFTCMYICITQFYVKIVCFSDIKLFWLSFLFFCNNFLFYFEYFKPVYLTVHDY